MDVEIRRRVDQMLATQYRIVRGQWVAAIADRKPQSVIDAARAALREFEQYGSPLIRNDEKEQR